MVLVTCRDCQRHVKREESACPFCGASLEGVTPRQTAALPEMSRAAAVFVGAVAIAGCGKEPAPPPPPPPDPTQMAVPAYGVPPPDTMINPPPEPPPLPPVDAGKTDAATPKDGGAKQVPLSAPAYGPPPQRNK